MWLPNMPKPTSVALPRAFEGPIDAPIITDLARTTRMVSVLSHYGPLAVTKLQAFALPFPLVAFCTFALTCLGCHQASCLCSSVRLRRCPYFCLYVPLAVTRLCAFALPFTFAIFYTFALRAFGGYQASCLRSPVRLYFYPRSGLHRLPITATGLIVEFSIPFSLRSYKTNMQNSVFPSFSIDGESSTNTFTHLPFSTQFPHMHCGAGASINPRISRTKQ